MDHIILEPVEFWLELELLKNEGEVDKLNSLFEAKQPIDFVCDLGVFKNIVVKSREFVEGSSVNTVRHRSTSSRSARLKPRLQKFRSQ